MDFAATGAQQFMGMTQLNAQQMLLLSGLGGIGIIILVVLVAFYLFVFWKLFQKAGYKGYESLIKGHNGYLMIIMAGKPGWWDFLFLIPILGFVITGLLSGTAVLLSQIIMALSVVGLIYLYVVISRGIAKKFGKGIGFTIGLVLLPIIFYPILALGKAKYKK